MLCPAYLLLVLYLLEKRVKFLRPMFFKNTAIFPCRVDWKKNCKKGWGIIGIQDMFWGWNFKELLRNKLSSPEVKLRFCPRLILNWVAWPKPFSLSLLCECIKGSDLRSASGDRSQDLRLNTHTQNDWKFYLRTQDYFPPLLLHVCTAKRLRQYVIYKMTWIHWKLTNGLSGGCRRGIHIRERKTLCCTCTASRRGW